ncbi:MAG: c-type cytochrome [Planctomycetota bacterium]|nr:c-type cytochrome [Planctomycetota bacterium]
MARSTAVTAPAARPEPVAQAASSTPVAKPAPEARPAAVADAGLADSDPTRALFVANCAQCHGLRGDGEGVTQLDRKARSFLAGGFSYGNTKDAIVRSITHGIPGTPMPAFEKALTAAQRADLAAYVIGLGPEQIQVDAEESEIVVRDLPVVVRGKLPPIVEGAPEWPRGIAIGTPEGLTFEYRADDVQLVGVRAGRFVNRADWGGRGGDPLGMLGQVLWSPGAVPRAMHAALGHMREGLPGPAFPSTARLVATAVVGNTAWIEYALKSTDASVPGSVAVREQCQSFRNALGSGFVQRRFVRTEETGLYIGLPDLPASVPSVFSGSCVCAFLAGERPALIVAREEHTQGSVVRTEGPRLLVELQRGREHEIALYVLTDLVPGTEWNAAMQERVVRGFCP